MPSAFRFCKYCGRELPKGKTLNFCPYCGKKLPQLPTADEAPPVAAPAVETAPPAPPITAPKPEIITPEPEVPAPARERKSRAEHAAKPTQKCPAKKRGRGGLVVLTVLIVLAAVCAALYYLTPLGAKIEDNKLLNEIDTYLAENDVASALNAVAALTYPEEHADRISPVYYAAGLNAADHLDFTTALDYFALCPGYAETDEQIKRCYYQIGCDFYKQKDYDKALECFTKCDDYYISYNMIERCKTMKEETELYGVEVDYELTWGYDNIGDVFRTIRVKNDNGTLKVTVFPQPPFQFRFSYMLSGVSDGKVNRYSLGIYNIAEEHTTFTGGSASEFLNNDEQLVFGIGYANYNFNPERKYTLDKDQVVAIAQG